MFAGIRHRRLLWHGIAMVALIVTLAAAAVAQVPAVTDGRGMPAAGVISIATLGKSAVAPGEDVALGLSLRNTGQQTVHFLATNPLFTDTLAIQDEQGHLLKQTKPIFPEFTARLTAALAPNDEVSTLYPVTQAYDFLAIGKYRITATRQIDAPDGKGTLDVVSNTVVLTVSNNLSQDFSLTASLPDTAVSAGKPIPLQLTLKNISDQPRTITTADAWHLVTLLVQDFRGDPLPMKQGTAETNTPSAARVLQPGESVSWDLPVNERYDVSNAGRYFITAMRKVPDGDGQDTREVYANTTPLTVAAQAATNFTITLPQEANPEKVAILLGCYGNGLALSPVETKTGVYSYPVDLPDYAEKIKVLIHQPGYQIVAVEIGKRDFDKPFTPQFTPLANTTVRLRLLDTGGKPIPEEQLTIKGMDWDAMTYFGYGDGMMIGMKNSHITVTTDRNGEATVTLPAWLDDPYYANVLKKTPTCTVISPSGLQGIGGWVYLPSSFQAQRDYPEPLLITKRYNATLTVRFDPAYLARQELNGILGAQTGNRRAIVVIQDPANRTTHIMHPSDGIFSATLQPGTYSVGIEISTEVEKGKPQTRYLPVIKDVTLKEKEERTVVIDH